MFLALLLPLALALPQEVAPVLSPTGREYALVDGQLVRRVGGREQALECTDAEGAGTVRGLAVHPGGTVFVAAERGLFVVADGVDVLDPLRLRDGAPTGAPVGVAVADVARLWFLTESSFGCLDARQGFGRTFGPDAGLPPGPYLGLRAGNSGEVWILTEAGLSTFIPGQGPAPTLGVLRANGRPFVPGQVVSLEADGVLTLELEGQAAGGATFRYRARGHHLWKPIDGPIEGLEPGEHELLLVALDRELRRSAQVTLQVRVPYPRSLSKGVLIPLVLGACLGVLALFLLFARRAGGGRARYQRAALSSFVALALGLQVIAALMPHGRSWPFVGFTMYTEHYAKDALTYKMALELVRPGGARGRVEPYDAGYGLFEFRQTLSERIHGPQALRAEFLEQLRRRHGAVAGFRILDERWRLTREGPVRVASTVLSVYPQEVLRGLPR